MWIRACLNTTHVLRVWSSRPECPHDETILTVHIARMTLTPPNSLQVSSLSNRGRASNLFQCRCCLESVQQSAHVNDQDADWSGEHGLMYGWTYFAMITKNEESELCDSDCVIFCFCVTACNLVMPLPFYLDITGSEFGVTCLWLSSWKPPTASTHKEVLYNVLQKKAFSQKVRMLASVNIPSMMNNTTWMGALVPARSKEHTFPLPKVLCN